MRYRRFRVMAITGYPITRDAARNSGKLTPELSAHVHDSLHQYQLVATYRSTDRYALARRPDGTVVGASTIGHDGALARAQDHADRLNAIHKTALHREHMRAKRG